MIRFILSILFLTTFSFPAFSQSLNHNENYDIPSQEQIESAEFEIFEKFGTPELRSLDTRITDLRQYDHLDPRREVPKKLLKRAVTFFDKYKNSFENQKYISVVDFSQKSNQPRMYIINMKTGKVQKIRTAHGGGGDVNDDGYVEKLSNRSGSHMSSRGYYQVSEVYSGRWGRSVRLDGLSKTNSRARSRAIVIHGMDGVTETYKKQARSWGCFSLAWSVKDPVVTKIRGGSLLYAEKSSEL